MMKNILVADDDPSLQRLLYYFLRDHYEIQTTDSAEDAMRRLHADTVDALLLDVAFDNGGMDGDEAVVEIRKTHPRLPVIALTGFVFEKDRRRLLAAGYSDVVPKPFSQEGVVSVLEKWLS